MSEMKNEPNNYLSNLNDKQLESVLICDQPLRVVAGAGSGKTRVITTKICYLIEALNLYPQRILAVTFTNKAANEMKERVKVMLPEVGAPVISTFHALCTKILRFEAENCNLSKNFVIVDRSDQESILKKIFKKMELEFKPRDITATLANIGKWKNAFSDPKEALQYAKNDFEKCDAKIYEQYEIQLQENNYVDFNDLLLKVHTLFKTNPEVRTKWSNRFDYILVDEFQDTNQIQFDLIIWLNGGRDTLTVVGDPDQTIYTWRGAEMHIIMNFEKQFPNAKTINLEENYRSTQKILNLANHLIRRNKERIDKQLFSANDTNHPIRLVSAATGAFEAKYIANEIKKLVEEKAYRYSDIYILYRTNAMSRNVEQALANAGIPYSMYGSIEFRDRKVIKDISSMLLCVVSQDINSTERVLGLIPHVGQVTIGKLLARAQELGVTPFSLLADYNVEACKISKYFAAPGQALHNAQEMYERNERVYDIAKYLVQKFDYLAILKNTTDNYNENKEHIDAFYDQMEEFDTSFDPEEYGIDNYLAAFIQTTQLGSNNRQEILTENKVSLMTIHVAKGSENKVVFIIGLNEGIFPSARSYLEMAKLEEERRTLYVAITRAQELLYLTYVDGEYSFMVSGSLQPSRFINELDSTLLEFEAGVFFHSATQMSSIKSYKPISFETGIQKIETDVKKGDRIRHKLFGDGIVVKVLDRQFTVAFNDPKYKVQVVPIKSSVWEKVS